MEVFDEHLDYGEPLHLLVLGLGVWSEQAGLLVDCEQFEVLWVPQNSLEASVEEVELLGHAANGIERIEGAQDRGQILKGWRLVGLGGILSRDSGDETKANRDHVRAIVNEVREDFGDLVKGKLVDFGSVLLFGEKGHSSLNNSISEAIRGDIF